MLLVVEGSKSSAVETVLGDLPALFVQVQCKIGIGELIRTVHGLATEDKESTYKT